MSQNSETHVWETELLPEDAKATDNGLRPLKNILDDLSQPVHPRLLKTKTLKGNKITFVPWHTAVKIVNYCTAGNWQYEVIEKRITNSNILYTVRVTIHANERSLSRDGTGIESLSVKGYGDPSSNAESMALRRALAKFGLGLYLYNDVRVEGFVELTEDKEPEQVLLAETEKAEPDYKAGIEWVRDNLNKVCAAYQDNGITLQGARNFIDSVEEKIEHWTDDIYRDQAKTLVKDAIDALVNDQSSDYPLELAE